MLLRQLLRRRHLRLHLRQRLSHTTFALFSLAFERLFHRRTGKWYLVTRLRLVVDHRVFQVVFVAAFVG
jgi:hypothetical protein